MNNDFMLDGQKGRRIFIGKGSTTLNLPYNYTNTEFRKNIITIRHYHLSVISHHIISHHLMSQSTCCFTSFRVIDAVLNSSPILFVHRNTRSGHSCPKIFMSNFVVFPTYISSSSPFFKCQQVCPQQTNGQRSDRCSSSWV